MEENGGSDSAPTKVCRHCSVQSETTGEYCPHCGRPYTKGARSKSMQWVAVSVLAALVVAGATTGALVLKGRHDHAVHLQAVAAQRKAAAEAAAKAQAARQAAAAKRAAAKRAADQRERQQRHQAVRYMEKTITKDAQKDVDSGLLDGPILRTTCDPLGGGSTDDLTALTTTFSCLAVNKKNNDGTVSGYAYSATMNWTKGSFSWHLGNN